MIKQIYPSCNLYMSKYLTLSVYFENKLMFTTCNQSNTLNWQVPLLYGVYITLELKGFCNIWLDIIEKFNLTYWFYVKVCIDMIALPLTQITTTINFEGFNKCKVKYPNFLSLLSESCNYLASRCWKGPLKVFSVTVSHFLTRCHTFSVCCLLMQNLGLQILVKRLPRSYNLLFVLLLI